jgi:hypothetical protein
VPRQDDALKSLALALPLLAALLFSAAASGQEEPKLTYPMRLEAIGLRLPAVQDRRLGDILADQRTIFYRLPQLYQALYRQHGNVHYGVWWSQFQPEFHANTDFPWETTLGLNAAHRRKDAPYRVINFLHLPPGAPILLLSQDFPVKWLYPEGTVVGEIIYVLHNGTRWVQEIRTRSKEDSIRWRPGIFRPVASRAEFARLTGRVYTPATKHFFLRNPEEDEVARIDGLVEKLPSLAAFEVERLLSLPFKDVTRSPWSDISTAPTADQDFHIVPKDYSLGAIKPSSLRCMDCHRQTQISIGNLIPKEPVIARNPGRHGRIRGSDGIFTWHPFSYASARASDRERGKPIQFRRWDVNMGTIKEFDPSMIDRQTGAVTYNGFSYRLTKTVEDSLRGEELPRDPVFLHKRK